MGSGRIDAVTRCVLVVAACWRWVALRPVRPELVMTLPRCVADVQRRFRRRHRGRQWRPHRCVLVGRDRERWRRHAVRPGRHHRWRLPGRGPGPGVRLRGLRAGSGTSDRTRSPAAEVGKDRVRLAAPVSRSPYRVSRSARAPSYAPTRTGWSPSPLPRQGGSPRPLNVSSASKPASCWHAARPGRGRPASIREGPSARRDIRSSISGPNDSTPPEKTSLRCPERAGCPCGDRSADVAHYKPETALVSASQSSWPR